MSDKELLQNYPLRRIKPENGIAITATVWQEAHHYHDQKQSLHTLFGHGAGILTGLNVIANDPADTTLYILPGVAIDPTGQAIVVAQPIVYDIGRDMEGAFSLVLSYSESYHQPGHDQSRRQPAYVQNGFSISAQPLAAEPVGVEIARLQRSRRDALIRNAHNWALPGPDEIDLRFRREVGAPPAVRVGVCYLGDAGQARHGHGMTFLAQNLNFISRYHVVVEDNSVLGPGLGLNTLVYLVGQGQFELSPNIMNGLYNYIHRGRGTILIESIDDQATASFTKFLVNKEIEPEPLEPRSGLLTHPYYFSGPPPGYDPTEETPVKMRDGIIFSTRNYGLLWQGEHRDGPASREDIRAAVEWGGNIINYAVNRYKG